MTKEEMESGMVELKGSISIRGKLRANNLIELLNCFGFEGHSMATVEADGDKIVVSCDCETYLHA